MNADECYSLINAHLGFDAIRFYGEASHLSLGRGLIYGGILYPLFHQTDMSFLTVEGSVYVITHECDVSQENVRPYNDDVLICPLSPFELFAARYEEAYGEQRLKSFLANIARGKVSRLMYFPRMDGYFGYGAIVFLNQMCGTKVQAFNREGVEKIAALSPVGAFLVERMLHNHFLRPKDEMLSPKVH
jgi:hypothetical protein